MKRREFLAAAGTALTIPSCALNAASRNDQALATANSWTYGMKPVFCTAYIDPGIESQEGQEAVVAKFPIALVPQDSRRHFRAWRDRVRELNPDIKFLAYQMVIEETTVPGPGHDVLRGMTDVWVEYPGGYVPTVTYRTNVSGKRKRIFDPRIDTWRNGFLEACEMTMASYNYDGLFLDQCTIYGKAYLTGKVKNEMISALDRTLVKLRHLFPSKLLIGNSRYSWAALNGELNEGQPETLLQETSPLIGRMAPRLEMFHYSYKPTVADSELRRMFTLALRNKAFFGCSVNNQTVKWLNMFDDV